MLLYDLLSLTKNEYCVIFQGDIMTEISVSEVKTYFKNQKVVGIEANYSPDGGGDCDMFIFLD